MGQPVAHRALLLLLRLIIATAQRPDDEVKQFPGYPGVMPSKVFTGYLKAHAEGQTFYSLCAHRSQRIRRRTARLVEQASGLVGFAMLLAELGLTC